MKAPIIAGLVAALALLTSVSPLAPLPERAEAALPPPSGALSPQPLNSNFSAGLANWSVLGGVTWEASVNVPATTAATGDNGLCVGGGISSRVTSAAHTGALVNEILTSDWFTVPSDGSRMTFGFYEPNVFLATAFVKVSIFIDDDQTWHDLFVKQFAGQAIFTACDVSSWVGKRARVQVSGFCALACSLYFLNGGTTSANMFERSDDRSLDPVSFTSGAFFHSHTDLALPGRGVGLEFTRGYSSAGAQTNGSLGWGWTTNYDAKLVVASDGSALAQYPDGTHALFTQSGGVYTPSQGVFDILLHNGDGTYTLTTTDQIRTNFSSSGRLTSFKDRNNNTTTIGYDGNGRLATVTDSSGRQLVFTVDASGRITQVRDPLNRTVAFSYNANGDLASVTDVKAGVTAYAYSSHRLATLTDSLGHAQVTNVYDSADRAVEQLDALNGVTCFYYGSGPVYTSANCPGVTPTATAGQTIMVDARGSKQIHQFDTSFRRTGIEDALGNDTLYTYESTGSLCSPANSGNLCSITDPLGRVTSFTYDARGNLLTRTDALNHTWSSTYDALNNVLTAADPLNQTTTYTYNANGNLTSATNALNKVTSYVPNSDGTLGSMTDPLSHTTSFTYDAYGNRTTATDALSHTTTYTYDLGGRNLTATDPLTHTTAYAYDNQNNLLTATDPLLHVTTMTYDAKGQRTSVTDANNKTTAYAYDNAGNLVTITDPLNQTVTYAYDANNNRTSMTNTRAKTTTYTYDAANRLLKITDPIGKLTQYTYDAAGNVATYKDPRRSAAAGNHFVGYTYDATNRLTNVAYPDVHYSTAFTYDAAGNRLSMVDTRGVCDVTGCAVYGVASDTTTYAYDALNRVASVQTTFGGTKVVGYGYDDASRRTSITYPDLKVVTYGYDAANRLSTVAPNWLPGTTAYAYDAAHRRTSTARPNGLTSDRTYDNADRLLTVLNRNGGTPISSFTYTLDNVGNRAQVVDTNGTTTYGYDGLYRLTAAAYPNGDTQAYTYDAMGNRLTMVNNSVTTTYAYDDADRLTQLNGVNNTLDANGNLLALGQGTSLPNTFQFNQEDRMHRAGPCRSDINGDGSSSSTDGLIIAQRYGSEGTTKFDLLADLNADGNVNSTDGLIQAIEQGKNCRSTGPNTGNERAWFNGDGLRVRERTFPALPQPFVTRDFTWDVGASLPVILQETRTQGGVPATVSYVYGLDLISVTDSVGGTAYLLTDGQGSTSELADGAGAVTDTYTYDVFGALRSSSGATANDFRYTGQQQDANANRGMYYLRARTYDPALGRFLQRDPLASQPGWSGQVYGYGDANPVNRVDPTGFEPGDADRTPTPDDTDKTPVAFPLSPAGTEDLFNRCLMGREYCRNAIARTEQSRRGGPIGLYHDVCKEFFFRCVRRANAADPDAYFDFDGAREMMRNMSVARDDGTDLFDEIAEKARSLPSTGSGGYLHSRESKEGELGCLR